MLDLANYLEPERAPAMLWCPSALWFYFFCCEKHRTGPIVEQHSFHPPLEVQAQVDYFTQFTLLLAFGLICLSK